MRKVLIEVQGAQSCPGPLHVDPWENEAYEIYMEVFDLWTRNGTTS